MAFLELKDIGKIYSSENSVAVGIRGINLKFEIGEFVAITGKSGCGKTTLLNVLSGMDSYEEGELFVNDNGTRHFGQKEWEEYRQKNISFIFQDYNIIESFTVLENVELALTTINDSKKRKEKAMELIRRVGLESHIKNKGSKLSGGQKQRTVIARALAKDSPIILADEPTGNLDSESSKDIIALLGEISKDKLVIVVTHNFEDLADFATRQIKMYDGSVQSDDTIRPHEVLQIKSENKFEITKKQIWRDSFMLGMTKFKARPKLTAFLALIMTIATIVIGFVTSLCSLSYVSMNENKYLFSRMDGRVLLTRLDGKQFSEKDREELVKKFDVGIVDYDFLYDTNTTLNYFLPNMRTRKIEDFSGKISSGRMPKAEKEIIVSVPLGFKKYIERAIKEKGFMETNFLNGFDSTEWKIVGATYFYDNTKESHFYLNKIDFVKFAQMKKIQTIKSIMIIPGLELSVRINENLSGNSFKLQYTGEVASKILAMGLKVGDVFETNINNVNMSSVLAGIELSKSGEFLYEISTDLAKNILETTTRQISLFFDSDRTARKQISKLEASGYIAVMNDTKNKDDSDMLLIYLTTISMSFMWIIVVLFMIFFISVTTSKAIRSTKEDVAIFRSMGISHKVIKKSMFFQLLPVTIIAVIIMVAASILFFATSLGINFAILHWYHYVAIIGGMIIVCFTIARKFNKKLMSQSVRKNLRREDK